MDEEAQLQAARDHLFQFRIIMRELYGTYEKCSYVYSVNGARDAVGLSYEAEAFVDRMLSAELASR